jgi:hypothetical protein
LVIISKRTKNPHPKILLMSSVIGVSAADTCSS